VTPVLAVDGLTHSYGDRRVLDDVSFRVAAGEVVAIVGPSGAGKTTLFRAVTQLVRPDAGRVELAGRDLSKLTGREQRDARRQIGLIFQSYNLVRRLSAADNVLVGRLAAIPTWRVVLRRPGSAETDLALDCLRRVGLGDHADQRADRLSGGQQQRVAIARALAQRTRVVLADEPVSSLDPAAAARVLSTLRSIAREDGIAVVCSLHQVDMVSGFADRVLGLRGGRIAFDLPVSEFGPEPRQLVYAEAESAVDPPSVPATIDQAG
jgi:phosphonate transport system ATP-binding protein